MTPISDTQEFARRFNEEEAIWRRFQEKRLARHLLEADSQMPESILDRGIVESVLHRSRREDEVIQSRIREHLRSAVYVHAA